jgi:hypothetical protein
MRVGRAHVSLDAESVSAATHNDVRDNFDVSSVTHRSPGAIRNIGPDETFDLITWSCRG